MVAFILYMAMAGGGNIPFGNFYDYQSCANMGSSLVQSDPRAYLGYACIQQQQQSPEEDIY